MLMPEAGTWIIIQSYKHDGTLHRCWDHNFLVEETADFYIVASKKTKVTEADGRRWYTREPAITFFSKDRWFNVICMLKEDGVNFYTNIATPTICDQGKLKYIDYDLDIKLFPNNGIRILDEKEYARHREAFQYSEALHQAIQKEMLAIKRKMENRDFPFIDQVVIDYYDRFLIDKKNA